MILFRIGFIALVLFLFFFGTLRLLFSKGYMTRARLKKWNRNVTVVFIAVILATIVMSLLATVDQTL